MAVNYNYYRITKKTNKDEILMYISQLFPNEVKSIRQKLIEREEHGSTVIADQIALPHITHTKARTQITIINLQSAVKWEQATKVDLIICVNVQSAEKKTNIIQIGKFIAKFANDEYAASFHQAIKKSI